MEKLLAVPDLGQDAEQGKETEKTPADDGAWFKFNNTEINTSANTGSSIRLTSV